MHQLHRHERSLDRRIGDGLLCGRLPLALRRPLPLGRRQTLPGSDPAHLRMGHGALPHGHSAGRRELFDRRQHERTFAHHRRDDLRRPRGAGRPGRTDGLRLAHLHHAATRQNRPRGDRSDRRAGQHLRLRLERRIVLDRRSRGGMDHGADRQGQQARHRRHQHAQGHRLGSAPHSRRLRVGPCQPVAHHDLPARRPRELPLRARCHRLRPRDGLLRRRRRRLQLLRRLRPGRLRHGARLRRPRVGLLPHRGRRHGRL